MCTILLGKRCSWRAVQKIFFYGNRSESFSYYNEVHVEMSVEKSRKEYFRSMAKFPIVSYIHTCTYIIYNGLNKLKFIS